MADFDKFGYQPTSPTEKINILWKEFQKSQEPQGTGMTEESRRLNILQSINDQLEGGLTSRNLASFRNTYVFNESDSLDATHPFIMDFEVVPETIKIAKVKVSFRIKKFRAYDTAASSGGAVSSASGGGETPTSSSVSTPSGGGSTSGAQGSASGGGSTSGAQGSASGGGSTSGSGGGQTSGAAGTPSGGGSTTGVSVQVSGNEVGIDGSDFVKGNLTGYGLLSASSLSALSNHTHSTPNHTHPNHTHTVANHTHSTPAHTHPNHTHSTPNHTHPSHTHSTPNHTHPAHTHTVTIAAHTHTGGAHTHDITFGIHEEENSPTIHFYISEDTTTAETTDMWKGKHGPYIIDQNNLDITSYLTHGNGEKMLRFTSDVRCRISARILLKLDIKAR